MDALLLILSTWLHTLATVILIGYYVLLSVIFMPALRGRLNGKGLDDMLVQVGQRARFWVIGAVVIFIITGFYLMLINAQYTGIGSFSNTWSVLMLIKHVFVLAMIVLGVYLDRVSFARLETTKSESARGALRGRLGTLVNMMAALGAVVLLLTAWAQAA